MSNKNNANIGFEKQIWDAACVLWGHIPAAEYRKVIIGLIFLRYISNAFENATIVAVSKVSIAAHISSHCVCKVLSSKETSAPSGSLFNAVFTFSKNFLMGYEE